MTPKMERFCHEYLRNGGIGFKAARVAGYSGSDANMGTRACYLLKLDSVKEFMAGHAKQACEETQLTIQSVLTSLEWAKEAAKAGYPTTAGKRKDLTSYIKACELQGKYLKMWVEKIEVSADGHSEIMKIIKARNAES